MLLSSFVSAQENNAGEWVRVQSDNGEFSIEFPAASDFFRDNGGFYISRERESYRLTEMRMLNAFYEKTLLSFEIYKTDSPKAVADTIADRDEKSDKQSEVKIGEAKFKQVVLEKGNRYAVRRFYTSKDYVYILTAASREGETATMKRFLDSLRLKAGKLQIEPAQAVNSAVKTVSFSGLKAFRLEIEQTPEPPKKPDDKNTAKTPLARDKNSLRMDIIVKPTPSYTDAARRNRETGIIRARVTFSKNGSVAKIDFRSVLEDGLLRETIFAAIRTKFIPAEKNGEPTTVTNTVEYNFNIY